MKKNKTRLKFDQRGSALVLTVILLVNALLISVAITAISIMEKKISSKTKSSAPAFQEADSGIEWALDKLAEGNPNEAINFVFGINIGAGGEMPCPAETGECSLYFIDFSEVIITDGDTTDASEVMAIRSVGKRGDVDREQKVTRALEAHAAPNCPAGFLSIGDFCVEEGISGTDGSEASWLEAANFCAESRGGRLCSAEELYLACEEGSATEIDSEQWTGSILIGGAAIFGDGPCGDFSSDSMTDLKNFRCCRNR